MRCSGSWAVMPAKGCDALVQQFGDSARMSLDAQSFLPRLYCVSSEGECHVAHVTGRSVVPPSAVLRIW